ncbi:MAG TPA: YdiU family protein, partial [Steroidobacteraceae bacterium]|nr:YdiU family protein [Steroidobacteraceae bacterium]
MQLGLIHSYADLPPEFHTTEQPAVPSDPRLLIWNDVLADELRLGEALRPHAHELFSGQKLPEDAQPIAMAYAGHQYAHFVPSLGDGRAILLGERHDRGGVLRDIQLKGSGRTHWSRGGDGRAAVGPMLREYLVSEAMHALGIPTTRSLAVVSTGEKVLREDALPGAVLTRVAASHVRVGTFQYFAARGNTAAVQTLLRYCIGRHYPALASSPAPALDFLGAVAQRQAQLIAGWMSVGFIHGVMNTDNMTVSGETIDFGPCAFMDPYDPRAVFSSIDRHGRYSFGNQPAIAQWNLARLAETLLPLIDADTERAVELATAIIEPFIAQFDTAFLDRLRRKMGLTTAEDGDAELASTLLQLMRDATADFTLTFRAMADALSPASGQALREQIG